MKKECFSTISLLTQYFNDVEPNEFGIVPSHQYMAEKSHGDIRFLGHQQHRDNVSDYFDKIRRNNKGLHELYIVRIDDKKLKDMDYSQILRPSKYKLDNSLKNVIKYNKEGGMIKGDALELLIKHLKPKEIDGVTYCAHIGEYVSDKYSAFVFTVHPYTSGKTYDPTYAFPYYVDKETGEVSSASAPYFRDELEKRKATGEKINITVM